MKEIRYFLQAHNIPLKTHRKIECLTSGSMDHTDLWFVSQSGSRRRETKIRKKIRILKICDAVAGGIPWDSFAKRKKGSSVVDPDPYVFGSPGSASGSVSHNYGYGSGSGTFHHQAKKVRKTLISIALWPFYDFLQVFRIWMFLDLPDPIDREVRIRGFRSVPTYHNVPDPQHWQEGTLSII